MSEETSVRLEPPESTDAPTRVSIVTPSASFPEVPATEGSDTVIVPSDRGGASARDAIKAELLPESGGTARIGRYVVLRVLGEGGMGVVFSAYDEELDRKVAIKVLSLADNHGTHGRARMQREAQALARLSHPNVVQVYDVGAHRGRVFLAMEYIEGRTLRDWLRDASRPWREVLAKYIDAGRGLAAAHSAGIVHRDFKPHNVIVGEDGRTRVLDFGLAKREGHDVAASDAALSGELGPPSGDSLANPLTQAGTLLGTPRYMSPEQHRLAEATARSDQFSFCVALYEGLYRAPAFAGKSARGYGMNVQLGRLEAPPRGASVPAWLRRVLVRGLAPAPEERWPSMDALLAALSRDPGRRWRTLGVALGLAALVAGVSYTVAERRASQALAEAQVCTGAAARLVGTWDAARGEAIARAFRATELSYAEDAAARVQQGLDARAEAWVSMHTETCKRHHQGELSSNQLELQMACLEDRRGELAAIVEVLSAANDQVVEQSVDAVAKLRPLRRCADAEYLQAAVKPPDDPETAAAVDELRARAMKLKVAVDTGDFAAGRDGAAALLEEARALGYRPLIAEALFLYGFACTQAGDHAGSIEPLREAFWTAVGRDANVTAAMAAGNLAFVHGASLLQFDEGRMWARHAEAFIERVGGDPELTASLANSRGALAMRANEYEEAERQFLTAIRVHEGAHGQRGPTLGRYHANLAGVYGAQYEWEKSEQHSRRAHELFARELGPSHPLVAHPLNTLGNALKEQGRYEEALALMRRSVEIYERAVGPEHPTLATFLNNLGTAQLRLKDYDAARETFARALAVREQALGPEHPQVATIVSNFAHIALETQQFAEAREHYSRALEILTGAFGEDSPFLALIYSGLGRAALGLGDVDEAIAKLERALELANDASRKTVLSEARFGLARALLTKSRKHRARALELARQARQDLERYDEGYSEEIAEIDAWLAARAKE